MNASVYSAFGIAITVAMTSVAQLVLKWQVMRLGPPQPGLEGAFRWLLAILLNPWMVLVFGGATVAALSWFLVVSRMPLSVAYPFVALTFPLVAISSALIFSEPIGWRSLLGFALIVGGLALTAQQGS